MDFSIREVTHEDYEGLCKVFAEVDALHRESLRQVFREPDGPRVLYEHRSSFHIQQVQVHPRFGSDGRQVLFTSDISRYGNVYLAEVPEFWVACQNRKKGGVTSLWSAQAMLALSWK